MKWIIGFTVLIGCVLAKHEEYEGYLLFEVKPSDVNQIKQLNDIVSELHADVWTHALPNRAGIVMVAKDFKEKFQKALEDGAFEYRIDAKDVKQYLDEEEELLSEASSKIANRSNIGGLPFDRIHSYQQVDSYLEALAQAYPETVSLEVGGHSFEGRPIKYLRISTSNFQDRTKPVIYMQSLLHAREWITLPATLYAIEKLVIDVQEQDLVRDLDWVILPIANPDGYVFTHGENRLWRKNRATGVMIGDICVGVDLNRNFESNWSAHSSTNPCSETFHGQRPFSESEAAVVRNIVLQHSDRLALYLDIHSFGGMILYGYGTGVLPPNALMINLVAIRMATAIDNVKMNWNSNYIVGNVANVLYQASGSAADFAQETGVPFSYTFELPGHRFGLGTAAGFLVDPDFIEQAGFETWEGIKEGARFVRDTFSRRFENVVEDKIVN